MQLNPRLFIGLDVKMRHYKTDPGDRKKNNTGYGRDQRNWLPTLNKQLKSMSTFRITNFRFWPMVGLRIIRSNGWEFFYEWLKVVSEVVFPMFWGVVSELSFGGRRCCFQDIAIRALLQILRYRIGGNLNSSQLPWL